MNSVIHLVGLVVAVRAMPEPFALMLQSRNCTQSPEEAMATVSQARSRSRARSVRGGEGPAFLDDLLAMAGSLANSRKDYAAAQLENLAESVRQFSDAMPPLPTIKAYATTAADSLEELANYVIDSDFGGMVADAREFSRRHPLATFGGSIAAGIVITQIVQSRAQSLRSEAKPERRERKRATPRQTQAHAETPPPEADVPHEAE